MEASPHHNFSRRHTHFRKPFIYLDRIESQEVATLQKGDAAFGDKTPHVTDSDAEAVSDFLDSEELGTIGLTGGGSLVRGHPVGAPRRRMGCVEDQRPF
jgi:hypothetical protein